MKDSLGRPMQPHIDRYRPMCKTAEQRKEFDRLVGKSITPWPSKFRGARVLQEARLYFHTYDPEKIGQALYDFSIMGSGGFDDIAHYNLQGFRGYYPHPIVYVAELVLPETSKWKHHRINSLGVYTDGLNKREVGRQLLELVNSCIDPMKKHYESTVRAADIAKLEELATKLNVSMQYPLREAR